MTEEQEIIHWEKLTPNERDMLVAQKIMGWQTKSCDGPSRGKIRREHDPLNTLNPPIGLWHCSQCGYLGSGDITTYEHVEPSVIDDYSTSLDAAWRVLQKIASRWDEKAKYLDEILEEFRDELLQSSGDEIYPATRLLLRMAKWTAETICLAAFRAFGYTVEEEEK